MRFIQQSRQDGFTIVELLIVVIVIAILATLTIIGFNGISTRATETTLKSDLKTAAKQIEIDKVETGSYPPLLSTAQSGKGVIQPAGATLSYSATANGFCLDITSTKSTAVSFFTTPGGGTGQGQCPTTIASCFMIDDSTGVLIYYNDQDSTGTACPKDITIPSSIAGRTITEIGQTAFYNKAITSIKLPTTITRIDNSAFALNILTSVTLPDSITWLGSGVFAGNRLAAVKLPAALSSTGADTFADNRLTSINLPGSLTTIGARAFARNQLGSVSVPGSVTTIGQEAFFGNQITSATIPRSVTNIGTLGFRNNLMSSVQVPTGTTLGTTVFDAGVTVNRY